DMSAQLNTKGGDDAKQFWQSQLNDYKKELPEMKAEAEKLTQETKALQEEARHVLKAGGKPEQDSHEAHARGDRFDVGELGLQLGVVLCSLAILTKSRGFWFAGLICSLLGLLVALTGAFGLFMNLGHH